MIRAGLDVARINASHADPDHIRQEVGAIREASDKEGKEIGIILDLMGPKLRVGDMQNGQVAVKKGQEFVLTAEPVLGDAGKAGISNPALPSFLHPGDTVLLDDGAIHLKVLKVTKTEIVCRVENGGVLGSRKGINVPGIRLGIQSPTDKDLRDLELGIKLDVDWLAMSFIQSPDDVMRLKEAIHQRKAKTPVIAKIEKQGAVADIEAVVRESDAVMVARGDLGVEMPLEDIPLLQKQIIEESAKQGKPVITATQMLQSMIENPSPTRAEVTDVANAVFDGTDAVMLSGETAVGKYPLQAIETMVKIVSHAETALPYTRWLEERRHWISNGVVEATCFAACELARQTGARAIVAPTESGFTAREMSRFRPEQTILAPTPHRAVLRRLALFWGVRPCLVDLHPGLEQIFSSAREVARKKGYLLAGDTVVMTAGVKSPGQKGIPTTNTIHCITNPH
jgi:pyruvate kinase